MCHDPDPNQTMFNENIFTKPPVYPISLREASRTRKTPKYRKPTKYQNMGLCLCQLLKAVGLWGCLGGSLTILLHTCEDKRRTGPVEMVWPATRWAKATRSMANLLNIRMRHVCREIMRNIFSERVVDNWNKIPDRASIRSWEQPDPDEHWSRPWDDSASKDDWGRAHPGERCFLRGSSWTKGDYRSAPSTSKTTCPASLFHTPCRPPLPPEPN